MEESEEAATESESERERRLRFEHKGSVVELELLQRSAELFILVCLHRIHTRKDHRLHIFKTGDRLRA